MSHALFDEFALTYMKGLMDALHDIRCTEEAYTVAHVLAECQSTVWLIGNGGSAALASHMATDLQLAGVRAQALTDVAALSTYANDRGYTHVFLDQLVALARPGDVLIALSGSGTSPNIVIATHWAYAHGLTVVGLSGFDGGIMSTHHLLHCPAHHMGQAQDAQQVVLHVIAYWLMEQRKGTHKNG